MRNGAIFNGRRSLHRVRTVFGNQKRIMSVLSYAKTKHEHSTPGQVFFTFSFFIFKVFFFFFIFFFYILLALPFEDGC